MKGTLYKAMRDRRNEMHVNGTVKKGDTDKAVVRDGEKSRVTSDGSNVSEHLKAEKDGLIEEMVKRKTSTLR